MTCHPRNNIRRLMIGIVAVLCTGQLAIADDHRHSKRTPLLPKYQQECSSCHIAYPPGMLSSASWQRLMSDLPRHFGADASLDEAIVKELSTWLNEHAGTGKHAQSNPPEDRITRSAWFIREHDEVPATTWKREAVKSTSNCAACHPRADKGDFNEHNIRIPR